MTHLAKWLLYLKDLVYGDIYDGGANGVAVKTKKQRRKTCLEIVERWTQD